MNSADPSPAMMIFNWRGPNATDKPPELRGASPQCAIANVAPDGAAASSPVEIEFAGFVVRVAPGIDTRALSEILRAVAKSASTPS